MIDAQQVIGIVISKGNKKTLAEKFVNLEEQDLCLINGAWCKGPGEAVGHIMNCSYPENVAKLVEDTFKQIVEIETFATRKLIISGKCDDWKLDNIRMREKNLLVDVLIEVL